MSNKFGLLTDTDLAVEVSKRKKKVAKPLVLDSRAIYQNAFIEDPSRYIDAQCSRRAGKSTGLGLRFIRTMEKHPKSQSLYLALTQESARDIMWPVMHELNDKYEIGLTFLDSKLTITHPNGAKLKLMGADLKNFIKRIKGRKFPGVAIDEAQDFGVHLQSLIDDVLTPSISDYTDGWLAVTGTPGPVPQGFFFEITREKKHGYSHHEWTILDNPFMPDPAAFIADLIKRRQWLDNNPTLLREWRNQWVLDVKSLWVRYNKEVNDYTQIPDIKPTKYVYILGIDVGYKDCDALALLAWSEKSATTYLVKEVVTAKQDITALAEQIKALQKEYDITKMIMDEGGLGKKAAEEIRRRHGLPIEAAEKTEKQTNVEILNDHLRLGTFKAKADSRFAKDSYLVQIDWDKSTPNKIIVKKQPHSDIIDAVLYAFKASPAFSYEAPVEKPKYGSPAWAKAEQDRMFEEAQAHFRELEEQQKRMNGME